MMLTISRGKGDGIVIDGHINVTIVEIRGDAVRLAIDLPSGASIRRGEHPGSMEQAEACSSDQ